MNKGGGIVLKEIVLWREQQAEYAERLKREQEELKKLKDEWNKEVK